MTFKEYLHSRWVKPTRQTMIEDFIGSALLCAIFFAGLFIYIYMTSTH